jgi:hypothetical protein
MSNDIKQHKRNLAETSPNEGSHELACRCADSLEIIESLERRIAELERRYQWAANELLACDYGDNPTQGKEVGWIVFGWRRKKINGLPHAEEPRIYGASIDIAIDREIAIAGKEQP